MAREYRERTLRRAPAIRIAMPDPSAATREDRARLEEHGYTVIPDLLSAAAVASLRDALSPVLGGERFGRIAFEGRRTERVYALLAKCDAVAPLVEHPRLLAICEAFLNPAFLLSSVQAVNIHPGEAAQDLHCDDDAGAPPRPRGPRGVSAMWALDDFTTENGSTRIVPGSHRWDGASPAPDPIPVQMRAGSLLVYLGGVLHSGGEHRGDRPRLGISVIYCEPWLRQFETLMLSVPPEVAARFSDRVRRMLGYSMLGPMGNVDGRDPIRLVEAAAKHVPLR